MTFHDFVRIDVSIEGFQSKILLEQFSYDCDWFVEVTYHVLLMFGRIIYPGEKKNKLETKYYKLWTYRPVLKI